MKNSSFIQRFAEPALLRLAGSFPVVVVTGPRQSGKTTLVRHSFPRKPYANLEELDIRTLAEEDPRGFLEGYPDGAVFDEVQRTPNLLSYMQGRVDEARTPGMYILTGSQQFNLLSGVTQSLAGRSALLPLLPFSFAELAHTDRAPKTPEEAIFKGGYPPLFSQEIDTSAWLGNYARTYIERDVRSIVNVRDLSQFRNFVKLCAGRTGQILNLSSLASDCGISHNTARSWISILETAYIVTLLPPYYKNFNKRIVKSPKLHFIDTGLAAWILGIQSADQISSHPLRGPLFESYVVSQLLKKRFSLALESNLYYWRDSHGVEIDILIDQGDRLTPVEVKSGKTFSTDFLKPLEKWSDYAGNAAGECMLVYGGEKELKAHGCRVIPWNSIHDSFP